jgi:hypothetical protein
MRPTAFINALKLDHRWTSDGKPVYRNSMKLSHKYLARGARYGAASTRRR